MKAMSTESQAQEGNNQFGGIADLYRYWHVVNKRKWLILGSVIVITAVALGWTWRKPRIYQATATVILDPQAPKVLGGQMAEVVQLGTGAFWANADYYNTQYKIIRSRSIAEHVVRKYELHKDPRLGFANLPEEAAIAAATSVVIGSVRVLPVRESRIIGIGFRSTNPQLAADLSNYLSEVYTEQNLAVKLEATRSATRWVAKQLDEARDELDRSETALYTFKRDNNILSVALEDRQNLISQALGGFSDASTQAKKQRIDLEARRKAVEAILIGELVEIPASFAASTVLEGLSANYMDERRKLSTLQERYGPKHPEVVYQERRVEAARADLKQQAQTLLRTMDAEISGLKTAETKYDGELQRLTAEALELNKKEIEYKKLSRDSENSAAVYSLLLKRLNESGLQEQDHTNNIRPLDRALVPTDPVEPNMRNAGMLGLTLGLLLSLGLAFFVEYLDRTVKSQEDIEQVLSLPFLGFVPSLDDATDTALLYCDSSELYILHPAQPHVDGSRVLPCRAHKPPVLVAGSTSKDAGRDLIEPGRRQDDDVPEPGYRHGAKRAQDAHHRHRHAPPPSAQDPRRVEREGRFVAHRR
jgi:polysaccharide biosynthesis transport protein